jgi:hypothetical protein
MTVEDMAPMQPKHPRVGIILFILLEVISRETVLFRLATKLVPVLQ